MLFLVVASYEFAYYTVRQEKNELDHLLAREHYQRRVDEFLQSAFPGWSPEPEPTLTGLGWAG